MIKKYTLSPEESARIEKFSQLTPEELKEYHKFLLSLPEPENERIARACDAAIDAYLGIKYTTSAGFLSRIISKIRSWIHAEH